MAETLRYVPQSRMVNRL